MRKSFLLSWLAVAPVVPAMGHAQSAHALQVSQSSGSSSRLTLAFDHVLLAEAVKSTAEQAGLRVVYLKADIPKKVITLKLQSVSATDAFAQILKGTELKAVIEPNGLVGITREEAAKAVGQGVISGRVTDAKTGRGVAGASVSIGTGASTTSGDDGAYRLGNVTLGAHTVSVRLVGYAKQTRTVSLAEASSVTMDFKLEPSANVLDQVIVTGTVAQTELKAVPNAITVITAKQIEERGITRIDQLFRGDIPGLFAQNNGSGSAALLDEVTMFSRGATAVSYLSAGVSQSIGLTNPIKTYVDGIELADPKYLSQIDPRSIERIEILTGPQASTIYGSNAINGVMQTFTKRGSTSAPRLTFNLLSGWVENNFSSAKTPQHDYASDVSGVEGRISYSGGGSWLYTGPWTPAKQSTRIDGFGGVRLESGSSIGKLSADVSIRRGMTQSEQRGVTEQTVTEFRRTGWYVPTNNPGFTRPVTRNLISQTIGLTISYAPASWWSHEFHLGNDFSDTKQKSLARGYWSYSDSGLYLSSTHSERRSTWYITTVRIPITSLVSTTTTVGADAWQSLNESMSITPERLVGSLGGTTNASRQPDHNSGGFLQTQVGVYDKLFVTYGLRAEWNPSFGDEAQPNYSPRYGVAYSQDIGSVSAKLRASYGKSTRPPRPTFKSPQSITEYYTGIGASSELPFVIPYYGNFDYYLANPELLPENQRGAEGGVELYFSTLGSLVVTRYNQTVNDLIDEVYVDSVRSSGLCPEASCGSWSRDADGYGYWRQYQYLNTASIRNQGWELQTNVNTGPFITHGTYSWTKSRTIGVNPKYRSYFANYTYYQRGATYLFLPEHTWAFGSTYARGRTSLGVNVMGTGRLRAGAEKFYKQNIDNRVRLMQNRFKVGNTPYYSYNSAYSVADLTASHRFTTAIEGVLQVQNLADFYGNDRDSELASMGRQSKMGLRIKTR